jgi:hypothetical protein
MLSGSTVTTARYKAPGSDQIPAELIQAGGKTLHINLLCWSGTKKN